MVFLVALVSWPREFVRRVGLGPGLSVLRSVVVFLGDEEWVAEVVVVWVADVVVV